VLRRVRPSIVRAVYQLPASKDVFLGLENGEVLCYRPGASEVVTIAHEKGPILSLGSYGTDDYMTILSQAGPHRACLSIVSRSVGFRMLNYQHIVSDGPTWLCTHVEDRSSHLIGVCTSGRFHLYRGPELVMAQAAMDLENGGDVPHAAVMGPSDFSPRRAWLVALYPGRADYSPETPLQAVHAMIPLPWTPSRSGDSSLTHPLVQAVWNDGGPLEVLGLDVHGAIRLSRLWMKTTMDPQTVGVWPEQGERFQAFARIRGNFLAGISRKHIYWMRDGSAAQAGPRTSIGLANPVATFVLPASGELLIVEADCTLLRVPIRDGGV
jgi:hypothetical protein